MYKKAVDIYFDMSVKDILVDFLLSNGHDDFYFFVCSKYSAASFLASAKEQVTGRKEYGLFRLFLEEKEAILLSEKIKIELNENSIRIFKYEISEI
ncbi:MAG TPA: DUF3240 family protein [Campylobacterales bacterium]|nr:DUF3240 family protein [Campylobacterales bacterium]